MAPRDPSGTRYRPGDYVVYRYTGAFTPQPVTISKQVIKQEGTQLEIYVLAERGNERLEWIQVVTDTPDNQQNSRVDQLYLLEHGQRIQLANKSNQDAIHLYRWTLMVSKGQSQDQTSDFCEKYFVGRTFACRCDRGTNTWRGQEINFEGSTCPDFLWTHGPARVWLTDSEETVQKVEVKEYGRKPVSEG